MNHMTLYWMFLNQLTFDAIAVIVKHFGTLTFPVHETLLCGHFCNGIIHLYENIHIYSKLNFLSQNTICTNRWVKATYRHVLKTQVIILTKCPRVKTWIALSKSFVNWYNYYFIFMTRYWSKLKCIQNTMQGRE